MNNNKYYSNYNFCNSAFFNMKMSSSDIIMIWIFSIFTNQKMNI